MKKLCRLAALFLAISLLAQALPALAIGFSDVPREHWAELYIDNLSNRGLINGYGDGTFRPGGNITFGEAFKLIVSATYSQFDHTPVDGYHWAYPYAVELGKDRMWVNCIISLEDFDEPHELNAFIAREQMVTIMGKLIYNREFRTLDYEQLCDYASVKEFSDYGQIAEENRKWVETVMLYDVVGGYEDGTFRPANMLTRAEVAKIIYQYYYKV